MYQSCFSCWRTPQPRGRLSLEPRTGGVGSLSNAGPVVSAHSRTLNWRCLLSLGTLTTSQVVLASLALHLVGAGSSRLNLASDTKYFCCILRGSGGERIMDIVPGGTDFELQLRWGVGQTAHTRNNPHAKSTGVY